MKILIVVLENFSVYNSVATFKNKISSFLLHKSETKLLGRWHLNSNDSIVNKKIDFSNYDHCGTCGIIKLSGTNQINKVFEKSEINNL